MPITVTISNMCNFIKDSEIFGTGYMSNSQSDLIILRHLCINGIPKPPSIPREVCWIPPLHAWFKVNVDGAARGCPGMVGAGRIFHLSSGFYWFFS